MSTTVSRPLVAPYRGPRLKLNPRKRSPEPNNLAAVRRWVRDQVRPTALDLFCGAGGLSLGLKHAGFSVLVGADSDPLSVETHVANLGGLGYVGDLSRPSSFIAWLRQRGISKVGLIASGLPCQPFSRAGRSKILSLMANGLRDSDDPRTRMWRSFLCIVEKLKPTAVLLENVPDMVVWEEGAIIIGVSEGLRSLGYATSLRILNAPEYGVPQHRSRLFIVGIRGKRAFEWPRRRGAQPNLRSAIGDLPRILPAQREERLPYRGPRTKLQRRLRRGVAATDRNWVYDHITRDVRPDDAKTFALLKPGDTYADLPPSLQRYSTNGFTDKYNRLSWNELSRSVTAHVAKDGYWYIHPSQDRTISVREAARIQTFPDWFRFAGQPSKRLKQIGNAVPPLLAEAIGRRLATALSRDPLAGVKLQPNIRFREMLLKWYRKNRREYPWRRKATPWKILMAEICLRRTRADQVVPVYAQLVKLAPTPQSMVRNSRRVRTAMRSLGLEWRARNMIALARDLVRHHRGRVPRSQEDLRKLPGVGDYVAGAVLTFGFGARAVLMDTNTTRIAQRIFDRQGSGRWQLRLDLYELAGRRGPDSAFNYALLDFGALICRAVTPLCEECPALGICKYGQRRKGNKRS